MYQLEVKQWLVAHHFPPSAGWQVCVDVDAMERAKGGQHKPGKAIRANVAETALLAMGVIIGAHPVFGRVDIVAEHPQHGLFVVEVEGNSSRQKRASHVFGAWAISAANAGRTTWFCVSRSR